MAMGAGDLPTACTLLGECLVAFNSMSDRYGVAYAQVMLSLVLPPDDDRLRPLIAEALQTAQEVGAVAFVLLGLISATRYYLTHGTLVYAFQLAELVTHHPAFTSEIKVELDRVLALAREMVSDQTFAALMTAGAALELEPTVNEVLTDLMRH